MNSTIAAPSALDLTVTDFETIEAPFNFTHFAMGVAVGVALVGIAAT